MLWCISWEVSPRLKTVQYFDYFKLYFNNEKRRGIENKPKVDKIRKKKFHFNELSIWFFNVWFILRKVIQL